MPAVAIVWIQFALCAAAIGAAGLQLSRCGDAIAHYTGMSRNWIGLVLLATVTSLPELVTGLSAVAVAGAPDIAVGDALGSCVFNLAILAVVDLWRHRQPDRAPLGSGHLRSAAWGMALLGGTSLAILLTRHALVPAIGPVGLGSLLGAVAYLAAMRSLYRAELSHPPAAAEAPAMSLRRALTGYGLAAAATVVMGVWLPLIGVEIAVLMGWTDSFVGTLLIALATSVPELATTWGALRIGAVDLAFGNLLGSNLFDVLILTIDDIAYVKGPLFAAVSPLHGVTALVAALMSGAVVLGALRLRAAADPMPGLGWVLLALYLANALAQWLSGG